MSTTNGEFLTIKPSARLKLPELHRRLVAFDPSVVPICDGSVAAALLFCHYEQLFREAGSPEAIERPRMEDFRTGLGYKSNSPQPWFKTFYRIGTYHLGRHVFAAARFEQREFVSECLADYVYYAMEVTRPHGLTILHRNHYLIEARLAELRGVPSVQLDQVKYGPYKQARIDAARIARELEGESIKGVFPSMACTIGAFGKQRQAPKMSLRELHQ